MIVALFSLSLFLLPQSAETKSLSYALLESRIPLCRKNPTQARGCASALHYLSESAEASQNAGRAPAVDLTSSPEEGFAAQKVRLANAGTPESEWVTGAFNAWLGSLDPHAKLAFAVETERLASADRIPVRGAGAKLHFHKNKVFVSYTAEGSGAEAAGLRPGDRILSLNGVNLGPLSETARHRWLSQAKSPFRLRLDRGGKAREILVREKRYFLANVEASIRGTGRRKEGRLRVRSFDHDNTCSEMRKALAGFVRARVARVRLDLSNNPGGLVREAQCAAGLFLGAGRPFARLHPQESADARDLIPAVPAGGKLAGLEGDELRTEAARETTLPLLVTINQNTASAAEMLAAALQDSKRALVEGVRSFGKGTMQSVFHPWNSERLYLTRTTHAIYRISGAPLNHVGVIPDRVLGQAEGENFPREAELAP